MADHLKADPAQLSAGAAHVDDHAAMLIASHTEAHGRMAAAAPGFIGASTAALADLTAHWEAESAVHYTDLLDHAEKLRTAAESYQSVDTAAAEALDAAGEALGDEMGL